MLGDFVKVQNLRDNWAFFTVMGSTDLWSELKKHMYPNKRTCNYDNYTNGDMAVYYGYLSLIRNKPDIMFTEEAMYNAIETDNFEIVKYLHKEQEQKFTKEHIGYTSYCKSPKILEYIRVNLEDIDSNEIIAMAFRCIQVNNLHIFSYVFDNINIDLDLSNIIEDIMIHDRLDFLILLHEKDIKLPDDIMDKASGYRRFEILKYLKSVGYSCTSLAINVAIDNLDTQIVTFLLENDMAICEKLLFDTMIWDGNVEMINLVRNWINITCDKGSLERAVVWDKIDIVERFCPFIEREQILEALTLSKLHKRDSITTFLEVYLQE